MNAAKRGLARLAAILSCVALVTCLLCASVGCSKIGDHSDEALEIQGQWQVVGTWMTVTITNNQIRLPGGTVYDYEIDTVNRTITFSVGDVSGEATYRISKDSQLGTTRLELTENVDGQEITTVFAKLSDDTNAEPSKNGGVEAFSHDPNEEAIEEEMPEPVPEEAETDTGGDTPAEPVPEPEPAPEPVEEAPPPEEAPAEEPPPEEQSASIGNSFDNIQDR